MSKLVVSRWFVALWAERMRDWMAADLSALDLESLAKKPSAALNQEHDFVGGVVIEDGVHDLARRDLGFDVAEEADELLMAVPLHVAADAGSVEHVQGREQGGGAMAL